MNTKDIYCMKNFKQPKRSLVGKRNDYDVLMKYYAII